MSQHRMHPYSHHHNTHNHHNHAQEPVEEVQPAPDQDEPEVHEQEQPSQESAPEQPDTDPLAEAKKEIEDMRLRMAAEMDNFKKRLQREHQEQMRYASEKVLSEILPALDNLDLALQYAPENEACKDMMQGVEMTRKQLLEAIGKHGLSPVGKEGEEFDPVIHEAIGMEARPEFEKGHVSRVLQKGYKLNDRLLRPAKVMVNN